MGIGIMKRVKNKLGKFFHKEKGNEAPMYGIELDTQPVCGNCKHFQRVGHDGIVGVCTHEKALHYANSRELDMHGKPVTKARFLAVMPHFRCGMRLFKAK